MEESLFNPNLNVDLHWKQQNPVLCMTFESPGQLNNMLCNYDVHNGYPQCFEKKMTKKASSKVL